MLINSILFPTFSSIRFSVPRLKWPSGSWGGTPGVGIMDKVMSEGREVWRGRSVPWSGDGGKRGRGVRSRLSAAELRRKLEIGF